MKKIMLFSILGALSVAATAQSVPDGSSVRISASEQTIHLPKQVHRMFQGDFDEFKGAYDLANGKTLSLTVQGRRMFAEVDGQEKTEIVAAARNVFIALDEKMKITIEHEWNGDVGGELLWIMQPRSAQSANGFNGETVIAVALR